MTEVEHRVGGRPAMTVAELQARYGITKYHSMVSILRRGGVEPVGQANAVSNLYDVEAVDEVMGTRKGTPGRPAKEVSSSEVEQAESNTPAKD